MKVINNKKRLLFTLKEKTSGLLVVSPEGLILVEENNIKEDTDISGKLDKVSTAGVERAYIINADGSQGTKATSEFGGGTPSLQAVTDIGNTTLNGMTIYMPGNSFLSLFPFVVHIENLLNGNNMSLTSDKLQFGDALFASNLLFRPRTQNTDFYFEDEGGNKSIATREWVNANNYRKWLVKDTTPTTAVTGTTSLTQIGSSILIPANTFSAEDVMILDGYGINKNGTFGSITCRLYHNTSNTLVGSTLIATLFLSSTQLTGSFERLFEISGGLLKCRIGSSTNSFSDKQSSAAAQLSITFNPAIDNYFFTTVQLSNASDSVTRTQLLISK